MGESRFLKVKVVYKHLLTNGIPEVEEKIGLMRTAVAALDK